MKENHYIECDVSSCIFNQSGKLCTRKGIKVCKGESETSHYCKSFEKGCGFRQQ